VADVNDPDHNKYANQWLPDGSPNPDYNPVMANRYLIGGGIAGSMLGAGLANLLRSGVSRGAAQDVLSLLGGDVPAAGTLTTVSARTRAIGVLIKNGMAEEDAISAVDTVIQERAAAAAQTRSVAPSRAPTPFPEAAPPPATARGIASGATPEEMVQLKAAAAAARAARKVSAVPAIDDAADEEFLRGISSRGSQTFGTPEVPAVPPGSLANRAVRGEPGAPDPGGWGTPLENRIPPPVEPVDATGAPDLPRGTTRLDKITSSRMGGLLSRPLTAAMVASHQVAALGFRPFDELFAGHFGDAGVDLVATLKGFGAGGKAALEGLKKPTSYADVPRSGMAKVGNVPVMPNAVIRIGGEATVLPLRVYSALHAFTQEAALQGQLAVDARRLSQSTGVSMAEALASPQPGALEVAKLSTLQNTVGTPKVTALEPFGDLSTLMQSIDEWMKGMRRLEPNATPLEIARAAAFREIAPLTHTAIALSTRGVNVLTSPVTSVVRGVNAAAHGDWSEAAGRTLQLATSAGLGYLGYRTLNGSITGDHPTIPGAPKDSVNLPGIGWVGARRFGLMETPILALANGLESVQRTGQAMPVAVTKAIVNSTAKVLVTATGVGDFARLVTGINRGQGVEQAVPMAERIAESHVPFSSEFRALRAHGLFPKPRATDSTSSSRVPTPAPSATADTGQNPVRMPGTGAQNPARLPSSSAPGTVPPTGQNPVRMPGTGAQNPARLPSTQSRPAA